MPVDGDFGDEPSEPIDRPSSHKKAPKKPEEKLEASKDDIARSRRLARPCAQDNAQRLGFGVRL